MGLLVTDLVTDLLDSEIYTTKRIETTFTANRQENALVGIFTAIPNTRSYVVSVLHPAKRLL